MAHTSVFIEIKMKMNTSLVFGICLLAFLQLTTAQFKMASYDEDCGAGTLTMDPFMVQTIKSKIPKKYNSKLDLGKDLGLSKLATVKALARHFKNLNNLNYDFQNLMFPQPQQAMIPDSNVLYAQQLLQQQQPQQPQAQIQIPFVSTDTARSALAPSLDASQIQAALSQLTDQRYQQPSYQLNAQSKHYIPQESQCSCEDCEYEQGSRVRPSLRFGSRLSSRLAPRIAPRLSSRLTPRTPPRQEQDPFSSIFSACLGLLKNFLR